MDKETYEIKKRIDINDLINELHNKLEAQDKIINTQALEIARLKKIARKMHLWIFLHSGDEQAVYDELGLTNEENTILGYSGQFKTKINKDMGIKLDELKNQFNDVWEYGDKE